MGHCLTLPVLVHQTAILFSCRLGRILHLHNRVLEVAVAAQVVQVLAWAHPISSVHVDDLAIALLLLFSLQPLKEGFVVFGHKFGCDSLMV